jgi:hypothetical protein
MNRESEKSKTLNPKLDVLGNLVGKTMNHMNRPNSTASEAGHQHSNIPIPNPKPDDEAYHERTTRQD